MNESQSGRHPRGLYVLAFTAMWEYFSYYGMRALLVLYMSKAFLFADKKAYSIYGSFGALVYVTTLIGAWLTKNRFGYNSAIYIGALLIAIGNITLTFSHHQVFFMGLAIIICGNGLCKPNIVNLVGQLYPHRDTRRDSAFTLFYVGANIGSFIAPLICGFISVKYGWNWSFYAAGIGMLIGLCIFTFGRKHIIQSDIYRISNSDNNLFSQLKIIPSLLIVIALISWTIQHHLAGVFLNVFGISLLAWLIIQMIKSSAEERNNMIKAMILLLFGTIFWAFDMQAGSSITLFTDRIVDRHIFGWIIPTPMFQSINPLVIFIVGPLLSLLWLKLRQKNKDISANSKFSLALIQIGLGFLTLAFSAKLFNLTGQTSFLWLFLAYFLMSTGELCCEPIGLSSMGRLSPVRLVGIMIAAWYLYTGSYANYVAAIIAKLTSVTREIHLGDLYSASNIYGHIFGAVAISALIIGVGLGVANKLFIYIWFNRSK